MQPSDQVELSYSMEVHLLRVELAKLLIVSSEVLTDAGPNVRVGLISVLTTSGQKTWDPEDILSHLPVC